MSRFLRQFRDGENNKLEESTDWASYSPIFEGMIPTSVVARYKRIGNTLFIQMTGVAASVTAADASVSLPPGLSTSNNYSNFSALKTPVGSFTININTASTFHAVVLRNATKMFLTVQNTGRSPMNAVGASVIIANNNKFAISCEIEINE